MLQARQFLESMFDAAVAAADPEHCMRAWTPARPDGRVIVVGAGKAAASMARELEAQWSAPLEGKVIVPYGYGSSCHSIEVIEASHPVPDTAGVSAAAAILECVSDLSADDTVVCLFSGGGSSLLCLPAAGIALAEKQDITQQLLHCGAAIHEINCVRKKLSAVKGGKLAAACRPAEVVTLLISDVPGNDISMVASGPTISDESSAAEALGIVARYGISLSDKARETITLSNALRVIDEDVRILATSDDALLATAAMAAEHDITPYSLGDLSGDARELGIQHAELALQIAAGNGPVDAPCVIISGGETTVNVQGSGRGGRNGEYAMALAIALNGHPSIAALAGDTDGIDGAGSNAGSFVMPDTLARATVAGLNAKEMLDNNDSFEFFAKIGDLLVTGPTLTNVNDLRAILISGATPATS